MYDNNITLYLQLDAFSYNLVITKKMYVDVTVLRLYIKTNCIKIKFSQKLYNLIIKIIQLYSPKDGLLTYSHS